MKENILIMLLSVSHDCTSVNRSRIKFDELILIARVWQFDVQYINIGLGGTC